MLGSLLLLGARVRELVDEHAGSCDGDDQAWVARLTAILEGEEAN